jgi:hypothetical protein
MEREVAGPNTKNALSKKYAVVASALCISLYADHKVYSHMHQTGLHAMTSRTQIATHPLASM